MNLVKLKSHDKILDLKINYDLIFKTWSFLFMDNNFLESDYMKMLMSFLFLGYKDSDPPFRPSDKSLIFKPFSVCSIDKCKAVIVTEYPTNTNKSSGLGVGNKVGTNVFSVTDEGIAFRDMVEANLYYGNPYLDYDFSLETQANEGILFLNMALTCTSENPKAHVNHWHKFIEFFLKKYQEATADKVFVFIGDAIKFRNLIDEKYHSVVIEPNSLHEAVIKKEYWNTECFAEMQHLVEIANNGDPTFFDKPIL